MEEKLKRMQRKFSERMLQKLQANSHKSGWDDMHWRDLLARLWQEMRELERAIGLRSSDPGNGYKPKTLRSAEQRKHITEEAVDVANFALFTAVNYGDIFDTKESQ